MRLRKYGWAGLLLVALSLAFACTNNSLDDGGGPNVVLEVTQFNSPAVTGTLQTGTCSIAGNACLSINDCPIGETCTLPVGSQGCTPSDWSLTIANVPKTDQAISSPFNDVTLETLTMTYTWDSPVLAGCGLLTQPPPKVIGLTIKANSTNQFVFKPISEQMLSDLEDCLGTGGSASAQVSLVFTGHVNDSDGIGVNTGSTLAIQNCLNPVGP